MRRKWQLIMMQNKKDGKALFIIHQSVDVDIFEKIMFANTANEAQDILVKSYGGVGKLNELLQMNDQESVVEYFTQILTLRNQMKNYGEKLEDVMVIGKIMRTLTPRFDYIVVAIEQGTDLEGMKVEEPTGILEAQELRLNERNSMRSSDQALQAQTYKGNSNNGGKNKKGIQCYNCKKWDHFADECQGKIDFYYYYYYSYDMM